jgi:hypothetical protein
MALFGMDAANALYVGVVTYSSCILALMGTEWVARKIR